QSLGGAVPARFEKAAGSQHPSVATTLGTWWGCGGAGGRYEEALPLYERSLRIFEKAVTPEHPFFATPLIDMAGLVERQCKEEDSDRRFRCESRASTPERRHWVRSHHRS
ncbi:hypothetical protein KFL_008390010, partial [Klebsormidium nitens]